MPCSERGIAASLRLCGGSLGTGSSMLPPSYREWLVDLVQKTREIEDVVAEHQRHQNQVGPQKREGNKDRPRHANLAKPFRRTLLFSSNLNLITDKGNIYSFTLTDITASGGDPDLKVIIQPADASNIVAATGPAQYVPAAQLEQAHQQIATVQSHVGAAVDEYKSAYPLALKFDYTFKLNEAPFNIQSIYHDDKFTYIKTNAPEKFSVYEMRDGKPNLINYDLRDGTYIIPKVMDNGYVELGKKKMDFTRKG